MKKLLIFMLVASMIFAVGCSKDNANNEKATENDTQEEQTTNPIDDLGLDYTTGLNEEGFFENVQASDVVTLGEYVGIAVPSSYHTISDEIIMGNIEKMLASFSTTNEITDRAVVDGDTVNIDYVGSIDGVAFDGGSTNGSGTEVTIGVTSYIDDFLEQLIGHTPGESFDIQVTFPEDYGVETLNGKEATFAITINHIVETVVPELTDAFVKENLSEMYEVNTVEALKTLIGNDLQESGIKSYIQEYLINNMTVASVPETVMTYQENIMKNYYEMSATSYGMDVETFLASYVGYESLDALVAASVDQLEQQAKFALTIQAIAEQSDITVSDEIMKAYFLKYTGTEEYAQFEDIYGLPYLKNSILQEAVLDFLVEAAVMAE